VTPVNIPEPMTPAAEAFAALHEVWVSLRSAEFSRADAAAVIAAVIEAQRQGTEGK
jgi:hypothetical protein